MKTPSTEVEMQGFWKSRIVKYEDADPRSLIPNPDNFKIHPTNQANLMDDVFSEIGWIQNVIVNVRTNRIIDGHLRVIRAIEHNEPSVPVTWVDLTEDEEPKAIALFDPSSQLAKQNRDAVLAAISKISTNSSNIKNIIDKIAKRSKIPVERFLHEDEDDDEFSPRGLADEEIGSDYRLIFGDCLAIMEQMPDESVDSIIVDLPYNITQAEWDSMVNLEDMWKQIARVAKPDTMIIMFSAQPFTTLLIGSNHKQFKYEIIWVKNMATGFLNSKIRPMSVHENICVFTNGATWYNPQMRKGKDHKVGGNSSSQIYGAYDKIDERVTDEYYPEDVIYFSKGRDGTDHPSEKPIDLMKYLVETYSNRGETILDFTMGSGSTGVAAVMCGRRFIGIDNDRKFFDMAVERIKNAKRPNE